MMNEYGIKDSWTNKVYIPEYVDIYPRVDDEFIEPIRYMKNGEFAMRHVVTQILFFVILTIREVLDILNSYNEEFVILCHSTNTIFCYTDNT